MTETTASIINNNQNTIMKTLALMTMALDIPTVIFSAYGMNFQNNWLPLNGLPHAFWYIVFIAAAMSASLLSISLGRSGFNLPNSVATKVANRITEES